MDTVDTFKVIAIVGSFITGLAGLLVLPLQSRLDDSTFDVFVSYSNAFGGGVILAVGLMHMLSDANESLSEYYDYPWAYFMALVGYSIVFLIEDVMLNKLLKRFRVVCEINNMGGIAHQHGHNAIGHSADVVGNVNPSNAEGNNRHSAVELDDTDVQTGKRSAAMGLEKDHIHGKGDEASPSTVFGTEMNSTLLQEKYTRTSATLLAFCLLVAISFHSFFAGLSIGVMTETSDVVATLIAVIAHKGVAAFVLGQSFLRSTLSKLLVICLLVLFAAMTPVGVGIGWWISSMSDETEKLSGFVVSLSAGTFIYIGSLVVKDTPDRLTPNPEKKAGVWKRYALWWFGCILMAVAAIWA
ncbi:hypothetical protein SARC_00937 [Sphaeroforma arctica JP610]|uniref:Zinc/iron permease n=1 Tax=Sphaeroforma arctica JP610 TaxID=667725 RepID=A0A0L0GD46_9EUKA|nr:hypothetical protein SARC_00937 [Sphaeroforma arctica JP610]KNC86935.1 hypothetical protein SARC_00937 [Sphaeroforma arctica JP610]|eukprot:XP_014160837.1 hypothetical protein SARC_00937 [Sphaeroforma arctica JP610]